MVHVCVCGVLCVWCVVCVWCVCGVVFDQDPATSQIRLVHTSKRKDLCETFKLDNQVDFDQ